MKNRIVLLIAEITVAIAIGSMLSNRSGAAPEDMAPIPLADVRARGIAGELGEKLGKIITVHGTLIDGNTLGFKAASGSTYIKADRVEGRALKETVLVRLASAIPNAGRGVTLRGYETGGYSGIVDDPRARGMHGAGHGYLFDTEFFGSEEITPK